jgi:hypothetical protein
VSQFTYRLSPEKAANDLFKLGLRAHRQPEKSVNASGSYLAFDYSFLFSSTSGLL